MKSSKPVDTRLERSPEYSAALARFNELTAELLSLDSQRNEVEAGLSSLASSNRNLIDAEAQALLSGAPLPDMDHMKRESLTKSLEGLAHRLAVIRAAASMQQRIVADLRGEVSNAIARDVLPRHRDNMAAVIAAALTMSTALQAERELRDELTERGVQFTSVITAMPWNGFDLRDPNSKLTAYLIECVTRGFCKPADLPDVVRDRIRPEAKGWLQSAA